LNGQGITVKFDFERANTSTHVAVVRLTVTNSNGSDVENFNFQAAVNKDKVERGLSGEVQCLGIGFERRQSRKTG
jgi:hypothetical protein